MSQEVKRLTRAEVSARGGGRGGGGGAPAQVWVIYRDSVYDVTHYVKEHPGGDVLLEQAGLDATSAFDDVGHSSDAKSILYKLKIGELVEEEKRYDANGKKRKIAAQGDEQESERSCLSCIFCGLL